MISPRPWHHAAMAKPIGDHSKPEPPRAPHLSSDPLWRAYLFQNPEALQPRVDDPRAFTHRMRAVEEVLKGYEPGEYRQRI